MRQFAKFTAAVSLIVSCAAVASCQGTETGSNEATAENAVAPPAENIAAAVPLPQPPMDRAALLAAVAEARSAAAAGVDDRQAQQQLDGKEFELRIRFGCGGQPKAAKPTPLGWSLDDSGVLRIHATPDISEKDPAIAAMGLQDVEAVEGFWLERPWLLQATCPAVPSPPASDQPQSAAASAANGSKPPIASSPGAAAPRVGIAQFFTATDPRTVRRDDRPYQAVKKLDGSAEVGQEGFDLVLSGRLRALAAGRAIRCVASSTEAAPVCVIAASFDHVWIEDAASKDRIADWSSS